jgi:hypothetical protein
MMMMMIMIMAEHHGAEDGDGDNWTNIFLRIGGGYTAPESRRPQTGFQICFDLSKSAKRFSIYNGVPFQICHSILVRFLSVWASVSDLFCFDFCHCLGRRRRSSSRDEDEGITVIYYRDEAAVGLISKHKTTKK